MSPADVRAFRVGHWVIVERVGVGNICISGRTDRVVVERADLADFLRAFSELLTRGELDAMEIGDPPALRPVTP